MCVVVVFVCPDDDVGLGRSCSRQHHHPDGRGGVDLPQLHCGDGGRECSCFCPGYPGERPPQTRVLVPLPSALQVLKEMRVLVWIFVMQNLPEVAFLVYLMYKVRPFLGGWLDMVKMNYVH